MSLLLQNQITGLLLYCNINLKNTVFMAAILFLIFGDEKLKIQLGIHHSRIQHPQNRLKRKFAIFYSKMPRMTLNELFSEIFPSLYTIIIIYRSSLFVYLYIITLMLSTSC